MKNEYAYDGYLSWRSPKWEYVNRIYKSAWNTTKRKNNTEKHKRKDLLLFVLKKKKKGSE